MFDLNLELFIAKKIVSAQNQQKKSKGTKPIITIATIAIAMGIAIMIITLSIVAGFQDQIKSKVIGFGSHIQITSYESINTVETSPISKIQPFYPSLSEIPGVKHIQPYATKPGIIKKDNELQGIVLKGIDHDFDWDFFSQNIIKGRSFKIDSVKKSNEVVISNSISKKLNISLEDKINVHFIQNPPRVRKLKVVGIYETDMPQFDDVIVITDIKHIQKLNDWNNNQISGFEVILEDYNDLDKLDEIIYNNIGMELNSIKITDKHRDIFGWLELQDWNVVIIISLMTLVGGINMISALLILILEKTNMIGMLKALGASNYSIRKIFIYNGGYLILKGMLLGNLFGLALAFLQYKYHLLTLAKETYYISFVPIKFELVPILLVNCTTFVLCLAMLLLPSYVISKISPVKAIKFN